MHSHQNHLYAIIAAAKAAGVPRTLLHMCLDGRDTPPTSSLGYVAKLEAELASLEYGEISTLSGRYYSMDRDKRWDRVKLSYDAICRAPGAVESVGKGKLPDFVRARHEAGETDEFIKPVGVLADGGLADGDTFLCFNYRNDRAREMFGSSTIRATSRLSCEKRLPERARTGYATAEPYPSLHPPSFLYSSTRCK